VIIVTCKTKKIVDINIIFDAPLSSLMDSITSPKVKTIEGEGIGTRSLARNTSRVEGHVKASGWDYED
jgi:hypothetical protein